jgi:cytoskeletal protein CcmA (bactofilin family)
MSGEVEMNASVPTSELLRARIAAANGNGAGEGMTMAPVQRVSEDQISVIGADILITGNIEAEVDLHIEGRVLGDVRCATLILGEQSSVTGSIYARRVRVSGEVEGSIETVDLAIEAGANVRGDVSYSRLRIANGGVIAGKMEHVPLDEDEAMEEARPKAQPKPKAEKPAKVHYIE